jgi:DnaJ-class molecular chaperone
MAQSRKQRSTKSKPEIVANIMRECDECQGEGYVEAQCSECNVFLTEANIEPGIDDLSAERARRKTEDGTSK